ncbi:hypothetical protein HDU93_005110 [Gonapodya sp. JEL0774]|nr:hypothetical protein HDU93_005110 [Gonapodya sp. JEL0774]
MVLGDSSPIIGAGEPIVDDYPNAFPRRLRAIWIIPVFALSSLGDLSVLLFYLIAFRAKLPVIQHPMHKLIALVFAFNLLGSAFLFSSFFVTAVSVNCQVSVFGLMFCLAGEYMALTCICGLLFASLVLGIRASGNSQKAVLVLPFLVALVFGMLTMNGTGPSSRDGACWFKDQLGWHAIAMYCGVGAFIFSTSALVGSIVVSLRSREMGNTESLRMPSSVLGGVANTMHEDHQVLSRRLILYPIILAFCAACSVLSSVLGGRVGGVVGEQFLMAGGFLNSMAFFIADPSARKIAAGFLELASDDELNNARGGMGKDDQLRAKHSWKWRWLFKLIAGQ